MELTVVHEAILGGTRRTIQLRNIIGQNDINIYFELLGTKAPPPVVLDGFVFGIIFYAMRLGQDLKIRGCMSRDAVLNLCEFQEAWSLWKPHLYKEIKISPEEIIEHVSTEQTKKSICAFSGGVDSIFTLLRHNRKPTGNTHYPLNKAVLMVHGFDVPLDMPHQLEALQARTKPLIDEFDLEFLTIKTNLKALNLQDWEDSFMAQLACCLHNYSHDFCYGIAGSSEPYDALILPWGSNPATDHLLSGNAMRLVHDGAGFSRTKKVAQLATHEMATRIVKVCWEGKEASKNCGKCEKCIRTQLNFLAVGLRNPSCFDFPLDVQAIKSIILRNAAQKNELVSIYDYAKKAAIMGDWVRFLKIKIESYRGEPTKLGTFLHLLRQGKFSTIIFKLKEKIAVFC